MVVAPPPKRRKLSPPELRPVLQAGKVKAPKQRDDSFLRNARRWNLEQDYEERKRNRKNARKQESTRLPIKNAEGRIQQAHLPEDIEEDNDSYVEPDEAADQPRETGTDEELQPEVPVLTPKQEVLEAKEELARLAGLINEAPEENIGRLKRLAEIGKSRNIMVKRLALATQMAVYKDVIPGYRIRPWTDSETTGRLTKEVKTLRNFEQQLVSFYQSYLKELAKHSQLRRAKRGPAEPDFTSVAISCATGLLLAVPHFNFRGHLLKIIVDQLSSRQVNVAFEKCLRTLETLFESDEDGQASLETVTMLAKMIKARDYNIHESVLNTFLHLRLLSEFSSKASQTSVDKPKDHPEKVSKKNRMFRTKKERKAAKELKQLAKEMKEADAVVSWEERNRIQADTLKIVFTTYFRILKTRSASLMGAVLEGLAKYAHLINQDFFGDLLEVLREFCEQAMKADETYQDGLLDEEIDKEQLTWADPKRAILLCITTAFELLSSQDIAKAASSLHLDLSYFTATLYRMLPLLALSPDIELSSKSLHLPNPQTMGGKAANVNARATATLLVRALSRALTQRATPQARVAAFAHKLETIALHMPERSATAVLELMYEVSKIHGRKIAGLWDTEERRGDGVFDIWNNELESANPYAGTVWAGEILRSHYAAAIREGQANIEKGIGSMKAK